MSQTQTAKDAFHYLSSRAHSRARPVHRAPEFPNTRSAATRGGKQHGSNQHHPLAQKHGSDGSCI